MATTRQTPLGTALDDGYQTLIAFAADPDVSFWEKTVTPPPVEGGDKIDVTTQHNQAWRTGAARSLKEMGEVSVTAAYDPQVYGQIIALINQNTLITVHFPDGSSLDFWGYLSSFAPSELSEGEQPEAEITIQATLRDNNGNETAPVYNA